MRLSGYSLSNKQGTKQFELPKNMELESRATLRIYVGEELYKQVCDEENLGDIVGDYSGAYICWGEDVWTGNDEDCARLYNPGQDEVARIEISPDMVDGSNSKNGCLTM